MTTTGMHPDEVGTDVALVRRLLRAQFPRWADRPVTPVPSAGTDNALYRLGDDLVVRLPRIGWAVPAVATEHRWVPWLAARLPVAVPDPVARGRPGAGYPWPWTVCRWVPGGNPAADRPADGDAAVLAADLGAVVAALHRLDARDGPPAGRGVPVAERDEPTRAALATLAGMDEAVDLGAAGAAWAAACRVPPWPGPPVWLHGDLSPGNVLVERGRLVGLLDFGCTGVGDPAVDLVPAWNLFAPAAAARFRESVEIDADTWARARGWALSIALIQLPYYRGSNPALADSSRRAIARVLADADAGGGPD
jgi:aminoglycoside phosphotransferase (APT) family kinase protein